MNFFFEWIEYIHFIIDTYICTMQFLPCDVLSRLFAGRVLDGRLVCTKLCADLSYYSSIVVNVEIGIHQDSVNTIPVGAILQGRSVKQLRKLCSSLKIHAKGRKCELIARLEDFRGNLVASLLEKQTRCHGKIVNIAKAMPHLKTRLHLPPSDFSFGEIYKLLGAISEIPNVTELCLLRGLEKTSFAKFGVDGFEALANLLAEVPSLTSLKIHGVHPLFYPDKTPLDSASAALLAAGLANTPLLRNLDLAYMVISDDCAASVLEGFHHVPLLTNLNLEGSRITEKGARHLARALRHTPLLKSLFLQNLSFLERAGDPVFLGTAGVRHVAEGLRHTPQLTTLYICNAKMGDEGAVFLAAALRHVPKLTRLDLSGNLLSPETASLMFSAFQHTPLLAALSVPDATGDEVATHLAAALINVPLLTELTVDREISNLGAETLGRALPVVPRLSVLRLNCREVGHGTEALLTGASGLRDLRLIDLDPTGVSALCRGLRRSTSLTVIDLSWPDLLGGGAGALARGLKHTPMLVSLNISSLNAPLELGGAELLSSGLRSVPGLTSLRAESHLFGPEGVAVLAAELRRATPRLENLDISKNRAGDAGAEAVAEALPHWPRLKMLHLDDNGISDTGIVRLADALPRATALIWIGLTRNIFGTAAAEHLVTAQQRAPTTIAVNIL